jgi:hypothetical protein
MSFRKSPEGSRDYPESILKSICFNNVGFNRDKGDEGDGKYNSKFQNSNLKKLKEAIVIARSHAGGVTTRQSRGQFRDLTPVIAVRAASRKERKGRKEELRYKVNPHHHSGNRDVRSDYPESIFTFSRVTNHQLRITDFLTGIRLRHMREQSCDYDVTSEGDGGDKARFL